MNSSENGWRPLDIRPGDPRLKWFTVPGTNPPVNLQLNTERDAHKVMLAFAAEYNRRIEKLRDADSAAYTNGNSVFTSNHKNATAMDLNWNGEDRKTFRYGISMERAYPGEKSQKLRELLADFEDIIFCGGFWDIRDWMHFQIGYGVWDNPARLTGFINRKIDSDGFFKSGAPAPQPQPAPSDTAVKVLYDAVPVIDMDRAKFLLPLVSRGLKLCKAQTPKEIAIWLANMGHESDGFATTEEYKKDGRYAPYIGRTWVQITWEYNYREFGQWCVQQGFLDDPEFFVRNPVRLADSQWAGIGPVWYCTVKEPRYLQFATAGDIENSAKAINAPAWIGKPQRANGIEDRIKRYKQAIALGDRLLLLLDLPDEEVSELTGVNVERLNQAVEKILGIWPSRSIYRDSDNNVDDTVGMLLNIDGSIHEVRTENRALMGDPEAIALVKRTADGKGVEKHPDSINQAKRVYERAIALAPQDTNAPAKKTLK